MMREYATHANLPDATEVAAAKTRAAAVARRPPEAVDAAAVARRDAGDMRSVEAARAIDAVSMRAAGMTPVNTVPAARNADAVIVRTALAVRRIPAALTIEAERNRADALTSTEPDALIAAAVTTRE